MTKFDPMEIDAPWGKFQCNTWLEFYAQAKAQLEYFLKNAGPPDPEFTKRDIAGYQMLIDLGCEETADRFNEIKSELRQRLGRVENLQVIEFMKSRMLWGVGMIEVSPGFGTIIEKDFATSEKSVFMRWKNGTVCYSPAFLIFETGQLRHDGTVGQWSCLSQNRRYNGPLFVLKNENNKIFLGRDFEQPLPEKEMVSALVTTFGSMIVSINIEMLKGCQ